jgi:hypothetical protein
MEFVDGYFDPPYYPSPVALDYSVNGNICEAVVSTSLQFGFMGYFISDYKNENEKFHEAVYYDTLTEDEFYAYGGYEYDNKYGVSVYTDYDSYIRSYAPAYERAVAYLKAHPENLIKYRAVLMIEGQACKLKSVELISEG